MTTGRATARPDFPKNISTNSKKVLDNSGNP